MNHDSMHNAARKMFDVFDGLPPNVKTALQNTKAYFSLEDMYTLMTFNTENQMLNYIYETDNQKMKVKIVRVIIK